MCDVKLPFGENNYPVFTMPPEVKSEVSDNDEYLKCQCIDGMMDRYNEKYLAENERSAEKSGEKVNELSERLDYELGIIAKTGFNDYFLIVADFMRWAREQDIPVGPGAGQGWLSSRLSYWGLQILIPCGSDFSLNDFLIPSGSLP